MTPEERSVADSALSKYLGSVEFQARELREFIHKWNREPDMFDLKHKVYEIRFNMEIAYTNFELEVDNG